ncbi:MAG: c-type cytochrome [Chloroflexi bacterium]|nr:c-type cytochrome [Chloroflexota bacterium]
MTQKQFNWRTLGWQVYLALALFVLVVVIFGAALVALQTTPAPTPEPIPTISDDAQNQTAAATSEPVSERVAALLAMGNAVDGQSVINQYGCHVCHTAQVAGVGPSWVGIAARAATRKAPMSAADYLYESITQPAAYVVPGYQNVMPGDFGARMSDLELADVIAYLLTPNAK